MDKISFIGLWDAYLGLLTPTQREITNLYFNLDLTVSEIAAEKGISRQAVSECLRGCKAQLEEYESKLHVYERMRASEREKESVLSKVNVWAREFASANPNHGEQIARLLKIINCK